MDILSAIDVLCLNPPRDLKGFQALVVGLSLWVKMKAPKGKTGEVILIALAQLSQQPWLWVEIHDFFSALAYLEDQASGKTLPGWNPKDFSFWVADIREINMAEKSIYLHRIQDAARWLLARIANLLSGEEKLNELIKKEENQA